MMSVWRVTGLAIVLAGVSGAWAGTTPIVGETFPNLRGEEVFTGERFELKQLQGKVVLVDFWATWCPPCIGELPGIQKIYREFHERGFEIVSVSLDSDLGKLKRFTKTRKMPWYHLADGRGWKSRWGRECGIRSIPQMFVLDRSGKVAAANLRGERQLRAAIEKELAKEWEAAAGAEEQAGELLAEADRLREAGEIGAAVVLYRKVREGFSRTKAARIALDEMKTIAADPELKARVKAHLSRVEAAKRLKFARDVHAAGHADMARKYYRDVIDKYPNTPAADEARAALAEFEE